ncbi:GroES-like protein [Nemania sp. FL0916]|nr:GroES-like protein [Nemania sp. FL0916]
MSIPTAQRALIVEGTGKLRLAADVPVKPPRPSHVLVKVVAVSLNPVDVKMCDFLPCPGARCGSDYAGTIVAAGEDVSEDHLRVGDRVCGFIFGQNPDETDAGAFAEYVETDAALAIRIPDHLSFENAATLGVGIVTAGLALFIRDGDSLELPTPWAPSPANNRHILVCGGATASGSLAIQLIRLANLTPIATCSPKNFDAMLVLGAARVFDYNSPTCSKEIRRATVGRLTAALDCITKTSTTRTCYEAIGTAGGRYVSLDPAPDRVIATRPRDIKSYAVLAFEALGRDVNLDDPFRREAQPEKYEFTVQWLRHAEELLRQEKLLTPPVLLQEGGLAAIPQGLNLIRTGKVSRQKIVYHVY